MNGRSAAARLIGCPTRTFNCRSFSNSHAYSAGAVVGEFVMLAMSPDGLRRVEPGCIAGQLLDLDGTVQGFRILARSGQSLNTAFRWRVKRFRPEQRSRPPSDPKGQEVVVRAKRIM